MATKVDIDLQRLKSEIQRTYASVSQEPEKDFIFPTGRAWAEDLDYPQELYRVPDTAVESFAGVANPFSLGRLAPGEEVLDIGCGAGTDTLVAAQMVAPAGQVAGIDMTPEMLSRARAAAAEMGATNATSSRERSSSSRSQRSASTSRSPTASSTSFLTRTPSSRRSSVCSARAAGSRSPT
jgi:2-polyprenyl-3-methyl-5-hydroxy-6-metoxy-1,4-benzoquinol methylase